MISQLKSRIEEVEKGCACGFMKPEDYDLCPKCEDTEEIRKEVKQLDEDIKDILRSKRE